MTECPVCYDPVTDSDRLVCGHHIHQECIINSGKAQCPICRVELTEYTNLVKCITLEPTEWGLLDKLVTLGWISQAEIPIIDNLQLPVGDDLMLVKAVLYLRAMKQITTI